jgi:hypothetical protein
VSNWLKALLLGSVLCCNYNYITAQSKQTYTVKGRAYYDNTSQGYFLQITDDGSGTIRGENISYLPTGEVLRGPVKGKIDYKNEMIYFQELSISNLPVGRSNDDYCFFKITALFKIENNQTHIIGTFTSKHLNGESCGTGTIKLVGNMNVVANRKQYLDKVNKKNISENKTTINNIAPKPLPQAQQNYLLQPIAKPAPKQVLKPIPKKLAPLAFSRNTPIAPIAQVLQDKVPVQQEPAISNTPATDVYNTSQKEVILNVYDYDKLDGDRISVYIDGQELAHDIVLKKTPFTITIPLPLSNKPHQLKILNTNEGYFDTNSILISITDGVTTRLIKSIGSTGDAAIIDLIATPN